MILPMTDGPVTAQQAPAAPRGRGLVIAGAILVGLYLLPALAMLAWFLWGLVTAPEAMSMVFAFWLLALLLLTPLWAVGIALLGAGRSQQRGAVKGATLAWILAIGGMPAIGALMAASIALLGAGQDSLGGVSFVLLVIGIPVLTVLALLSGAWLTWGKPRVA
jgi:hypothetical protein